MKSRIAALATAIALTAGGLSVAMAPPAAAACPEMGKTFYKIYNGDKVWKKTSLSSSYIKGPGSISLKLGRSWTVSASMTASVTAEAGVVFAKASATLGITVGASYSDTLDKTYTLSVPKGKVRRLQQYKRAYKFGVKKTRLDSKCIARTVYNTTVTAPIASGAEKYFLYKLVS